MIGRICIVFPGHRLLDCLNMTERQLRRLYWESFRQEAREMLSDIQVLALSKGGERAKDSLNSIQLTAFPFDPESDGEFDKEDIFMLRQSLLRGF